MEYNDNMSFEEALSKIDSMYLEIYNEDDEYEEEEDYYYEIVQGF